MKSCFLLCATLIVSSLSLVADVQGPIDPKTYDNPVRVACVGDSITQGNKRGD